MAKQLGIQGINALAHFVLEGLADRERDVLERRYGLLGDGTAYTLAAIGDRYHITRERVRQIEALALSLAGKHKEHQAIVTFVDRAVRLLRERGGVEREDAFFASLAMASGEKNMGPRLRNAMTFLLEFSGKLSSYREDDRFHTFWYFQPSHRTELVQFVKKMSALVGPARHKLFIEPAQFVASAAHIGKQFRLDAPAAMRWVEASKQFAVNEYGIYGLSVWPEISPCTARDWAYLVLKKEQKPLHFVDLSERIRKFRKGKQTNIQTVHNELIKDERFVLVGRGTYGLSEFGIVPGTAREVLAHFLKRYGPLTFRELARTVLNERIFKESTLLINLQNKDSFKKLADGRYTLKEA